MKRFIAALVAVFAAWSVMDYLIHVVMLDSAYRATAQLWRPPEEMNMVLMSAVTLIIAAAFTGLYAQLVFPKSPPIGLVYGLFFGIIFGVSMGLGSYAYMPVPFTLAMAWLFGSLVECAVAGWLVGAIIREKPAPGRTDASSDAE